MKITIFTIGSRGDVEPMVALGRGLQESGHTVTVVTLLFDEGETAGFSI